MTLDFRANQVRGNKIISSGSTGTGANIVIYDIGADDSASPNQGNIDLTIFDTSTIGTDVFLAISGTIGSKSVADSHGITLFMGDTHTSGSIFVEQNQSVKVYDIDVGAAGDPQYGPRPSLTVAGGTVIVSGSGGHLNLFAGAGGGTEGVSGYRGGSAKLRGGTGGGGIGSGASGQGGDVEITAGLGGIGETGAGGTGGSINISAGAGGYTFDGGGADGGDILINCGGAGALENSAGDLTVEGGISYTRDYLMASGSSVNFGVSDFSRFKRFFINQSADPFEATFPGTDIFFYVSGSITSSVDLNKSKAVFGGDVLVSGSLASKITKTFVTVGSYASTNATSSNAMVVGQTYFDIQEVPNHTINFRTVLSTTDVSALATIQLYNLTSGSFVHIGGPGLTVLSSSSTTPNVLQSPNLIGATNFSTSSAIYEVRIYTSTGSQSVIHGNSQMVCGG